MKKIKFTLIMVLLFGSFILPAWAFESNALVNLNAPYKTIYAGTFENLVMDFSLVTPRSGMVKALAIQNAGTADYLKQIKYMTLWIDQGDYGFQGMGVDKYLGNFDFSAHSDSWYIDTLNQPIENDLRFFVTVEAYSFIDEAATVQMKLPAFVDNDQDGNFDVGDLGIFMDLGDNGPLDSGFKNSEMQIFSRVDIDQLGPKISISNLSQGQLINSDFYTINGFVRDQGGSQIASFKINIDGQEYDVLVDNKNSSLNNSQAWSFDWKKIEDGQHLVSFLAIDALGNQSRSEDFILEVKNQPISLAKSELSISKKEILNSGLDSTKVTIKLKDDNGQPVAGRYVKIRTNKNSFLTPFDTATDQSGYLGFVFGTHSLSKKYIAIEVDGRILKTFTVDVVDEFLNDQRFYGGELIKGSGSAVYYYSNNKNRWAFPNSSIYFSWFSDFKNVKTIADEELNNIPLVGNVTYRPGDVLIKFSSLAKVYALDENNNLHWITSEEIARELYGDHWNQLIIQLPDSLFADYGTGFDLIKASDYNVWEVKLEADISNFK